MKILINYAAQNHFGSQKRNSASGIIGGFNRVIEYGVASLDEKFREKNKVILEYSKGAGYWLWKPYIILETMEESKEGDFIFYSDAGAEFISSADSLIKLCENTKGVFLFHTDPVAGNIELVCTKRDAFILMDCDSSKYTQGLPLNAAFQLYRNNSYSREFVAEYLECCKDGRILTDIPNQCGMDNYAGFKEHRWDQSVLSLLAKKWDIESHRDPTQHGNPYIKPEDGYKQIINHTRTWD